MNKILKIFLTVVLSILMTVEIMPVNIVHAVDTGSGDETVIPEEPAQEETGTEQTEPPVNSENGENTGSGDETVIPEEPAQEETGTEEGFAVSDNTGAEQTDRSVKSEEPKEEVVFNETAYFEEFTKGLDGLVVIVEYEANTLPEKTNVKVEPASEEALEAIRAQCGDNISVKAADISFWLNDEEFEPQEYDAKVSVTLSLACEDGLSNNFETVHLAESLDKEGTVVYDVKTIDADKASETKEVEVPVYEEKEIMKKERVPVEEEVTKYREEDVYGYVDEEYEETVPVYEEKEVTEEHTEIVTKTREVVKTRRVKVKVNFVWWNPSTWSGYKWVTETYTEIETYEEPVTVTETKTVQELIGYETITKTRSVYQKVGTNQVEDGTETVITGYIEQEVGTGEYETVLTGYTTKTIVVKQTATFEASEFSTYAIVGTGDPIVTLEAGSQYVICIGTNAVRNDTPAQARTISVDGNTVTSDRTDIEWTLVDAGNGQYRFRNGNNYLSMLDNNSSTQGRTTTYNRYQLTSSTTQNDNSLWEYDSSTRVLHNVGRNRDVNFTNIEISYNSRNGVSTYADRFNGTGSAGTVYLAKLKQPTITIHYVHENGHPLHTSAILGSPSVVIPNIVNNGNAAIHDIVIDISGSTYHNTYIDTSVPNESAHIISEDAVQIIPELKGVSGAWQYQAYGFETYYSITNDTDIYVVYGDPYITNASSQSTDPETPEIATPDAGKYLVYNGDGTNTLSLSITATSASVDNVKGANVIMVFDISSSMYNNRVYEVGLTPNGERRLYWGKKAAEDTVSTLLGLNEGKDQPLVELALITFAGDAYRITDNEGTADNSTGANAYWFTDKAELNGEEDVLTDGVIGKLTTRTGTNWEKALRVARAVASAKISNEIQERTTDEVTGKADPTYVIFITDGEPSYYMNGDAIVSNTGVDPTLDETNANRYYRLSRNYMRATDEARGIVQDGLNLYCVGIFGTLDVLGLLTNFAYNGRSFVGDISDTGNAEVTASRQLQGQYFYPSTSTADMNSALSKIAQLISKSLNLAGVSFNDGLATDSAAMTLSTTVSGSASGVTYSKTGGTSASFTVKVDETGVPIFTIGGNQYEGITKENITYKQLTTNDQGEVVETTKNDGKIYSYTLNGVEYKMSIATFDTTNSLHWDLSTIGTLEGGATYTISFIIWPNQDAYDYVANLNNGITGYTWDTSIEDEEHHNTQYGYYWGGVSRYPSIVKYSDGTFAVLTNTSQDVTYYIANEDENGKVTYTTGDPVPLYTPKPAELTSSSSTIEKQWNTQLQMRKLVNYLYNNVVWGADGNITSIGESRKKVISFTVTRDNQTYKTIELGWDDDKNAYVWADDPEDLVEFCGIKFGSLWSTEFTLAPGILLSDTRFNELGLSSTEYPDTVTYNGVVYHILETGHDYDVVEDPNALNYNFDYVHEIYHPMLVDGVLYNASVERDTNGKITAIKSMTVMNTGVRVYNTLRGGINVDKIVVDGNDEIYETDDKFTFLVTLTNETEGTFEGDNTPWYAINGCYYHDEDWNLYNASKPTDGAFTLTDEDGNQYPATSADFSQSVGPATVTFTKGEEEVTISLYGNALTPNNDGTEATGVISIVGNQNKPFRIANVPIGTEYEIEEVQLAGYELSDIEIIVRLNNTEETEVTEGIDLVNGKVNGEIVADREINITFTNQITEDAFYVYHSSDNTIEKILYADSRVINHYDTENDTVIYEFNIVNETKNNTLYGGYYKAYTGAVTKDEDIPKLEYDESNWTKDDSTATQYTAAKANVWKSAEAYKTDPGTAMHPEINTVYYLKEVPNGYIRPYIHFTYDNYDEEKPIRKLYIITATDDVNYKNCGYLVMPDKDKENAPNKSMVVSIKKPDGTVDATLTAKSVFNTKYNVTRGYLYWSDCSNLIGETSFKYIPCWETLDGVVVEGFTVRTVKDITSQKIISVDDKQNSIE